MVIDRAGRARKQSHLMCTACILAHIVITYTLGDQWLVHKECLGVCREHPGAMYHTRSLRRSCAGIGLSCNHVSEAWQSLNFLFIF